MSDEINHDRRRFVGAAATTVAAAQFGVIAPAVADPRASKKVARDVSRRSETAGTDATVVLAHGAWADGSSWAHVITLLQSEGLKTMAAPIPLTSLSDDVAALERALERTDGPVVLVAHAYAGAVIGAVTQDRVRSLVFISALSPDEGETVAQIFYRDKPSPEAPKLTPDSHGFLWMPNDRFGAAWCQHARPEQAALLCRDPASHCRRGNPGKGSESCMEGKAVVVPGRRGGSNDQSGDTAIPGTTDGCAGSLRESRSCIADHRAEAGRRNDTRGRRQRRSERHAATRLNYRYRCDMVESAIGIFSNRRRDLGLCKQLDGVTS